MDMERLYTIEGSIKVVMVDYDEKLGSLFIKFKHSDIVDGELTRRARHFGVLGFFDLHRLLLSARLTSPLLFSFPILNLLHDDFKEKFVTLFSFNYYNYI